MYDDRQPTCRLSTDSQSVKIALHQNIATNGRWFCLMLFLMCIRLGLMRLALLSALPVGLSVIVDQLPAGALRSFLSAVVYGVTVAAALLLLIVLIILG
ncbi:hypothetical protein EOS93_25240 [Rhizobium sp. RMa-01]|uniref:hypothetical protein n=1 Tax=unclassified Rhizobium TaxID=2613769 RepID=UPI0008DA9240|nr:MULTISPECIES: hypothetical protein [unclassified Rhizobium]OHV24935.1 hypothetical protein BBJ66_22595 [Rhizobium sp. RSm-3]RVU08358.1 hypothetical protein EOS93_25240 [Rhizobium sp. RMa-01]